MAILPRPDVNVTSRETDVGQEVDITVSRDSKARTYTGGGAGFGRDGAVREAVERLINDPHFIEVLPGPGE